ncbi:MAG: DUF1801 domain-containing protein [Crocinitomicaceae bacterium]|nr:DUF1801 domain-containing protein [Crocinitomicaceae bacterium]
MPAKSNSKKISGKTAEIKKTKKEKAAAPVKKLTKPTPKGKLVEIKTKPTASSVKSFIESVQDEQKVKDAFVILKMMETASKEKPKMWGSSIIGFGDKRYKSPTTGREVDWFQIGFSPRKANLSLYIQGAVQNQTALKKLGKHKTGAGCLYINKLADIDLKVLERLIIDSLK